MAISHERGAWRAVIMAATRYARALEKLADDDASETEVALAEQGLGRAAWKWSEERRVNLATAASAALKKVRR